jgi:phasin family protein
MLLAQEQIQKAGKANAEAVLSASMTQFAAFQNLATLNLEALKSALDAWAGNAGALLAARDPQELLRAQASFVQPGVQSALEYWQSVYWLASQAQTEMAKVAERRLAETRTEFNSMVNEISKNFPATAPTNGIGKARKAA